MIPGIGANIALYFFLAGTGAGMYVAAWVLRAFGLLPREHADARAVGLAVAFLPIVLVAAGGVFLFADLGVPALAHLVLLKPFTSTISFGAWSVLLFLTFASSRELARRLGVGLPAAVFTALDVLAFAAACSVAVYTGVYLFRTFTVPFWHTPAVVMLFATSSLTCGSAALALVYFFGTEFGRAPLLTLSRACNALSVFEVLFVTWFCASRAVGPGNSPALLHELLAGGHAAMFWVFVALMGIAVPVAMRLLSRRSPNVALFLAAPLCTLAGGFALRCSIILL